LLFRLIIKNFNFIFVLIYYVRLLYSPAELTKEIKMLRVGIMEIEKVYINSIYFSMLLVSVYTKKRGPELSLYSLEIQDKAGGFYKMFSDLLYSDVLTYYSYFNRIKLSLC